MVRHTIILADYATTTQLADRLRPIKCVVDSVDQVEAEQIDVEIWWRNPNLIEIAPLIDWMRRAGGRVRSVACVGRTPLKALAVMTQLRLEIVKFGGDRITKTHLIVVARATIGIEFDSCVSSSSIMRSLFAIAARIPTLRALVVERHSWLDDAWTDRQLAKHDAERMRSRGVSTRIVAAET